ncbi:MAG: hypothetical protein U1F18_04355 [Steroidobacteraceae bacterium]
MLIKDYRLLSFGCLGTLVDRDSGIATALRPLAARSGKGARREDLLAAFARHEAAARDSGKLASLSEVLAEAHARLAREWGATCSEGDHRLFARSVRDWPAFPDAAGSLQYLKRYFRLALVSAADRDTLRTIDRQLEAGFDLVCAAPEDGALKPDSRIFGALLSGAARLGVPPGRALHVAAHLDHDLAPAAESGLDCAWLDRPGRQPGAATGTAAAARHRFEYVFTSLAHLVRTHQEQLRA